MPPTPLTVEQRCRLAQLARAAAEALRDAGQVDPSKGLAEQAWAQVEADLAGAQRYWRTVFFNEWGGKGNA